MGKRLPKDELLAEIRAERARLLATIASVPKRLMAVPEMNDRIFRKHRRKSAAAVLRELEGVHRRTLVALDRLTDDDLTTLGRFAWTGKSWTLSDFFRASTASRYRWASTKIRR